jgi:class 3 adenylate cyclase
MAVLEKNISERLEAMADSARVWIYQSTREFTDNEVAVLRSQLRGFTNEWAAHSKQLAATGDVLYNRFVILAVDEAMVAASGCSIDSSVRFIQELENQYNTQLFERMIFAYLDEQDQVKTATAEQFKALFTEGVVTPETLVFDNLVNSIGALKTAWIKPLKSSWHHRFV